MHADSQNKYNRTGLFGAAFVASGLVMLMLAGSFYFFMERMLFIDAPHVLFRILNDTGFKISDFRYGSFITQLFPLTGDLLHVPLKTTMMLYSGSFYIFYSIVVLLLVFFFRQPELAVLFGLYLLLFVSDTYYWPNNEVHQGIAWLMLAIAATFHVARLQKTALTAVVFVLLTSLAIWTHPLVMLVAIYLWVFLAINRKLPFTGKVTLGLTLLLFILAFLKFNQGRTHGYDSTKIELFHGVGVSVFSSVWRAPQLRRFLVSCITDYWLFTLLFFAGVAAALYCKKYLAAIWTVFFVAVYVCLLCVTFSDGTAKTFYIESEYMPITIIGCAPFVYYVLPKMNMGTAAVLMCCIGFLRFGYIIHSSHKFTARVSLMERMLQKMDDKRLFKVVVQEPAPYADSVLIMNWGAPVESLLLSALNGEYPQRTFLFAQGAELTADTTISADTLIGCWDLRSPAKVNSRYFCYDTACKYSVVRFDELMK